MKQFAEGSEFISEKADRTASALGMLGRAADARSQVLALMGFMVAHPEEREYQAKQAIELANRLST